MNSIFFLSAAWCLLLISAAALNWYKEKLKNRKERSIRLSFILAALLAIADGAGSIWLFVALILILSVQWYIYAIQCREKKLFIIIYAAAAAAGTAAAVSGITGVAASIISSAIILMYIMELHEKMSRDELTGLYNRRELDRYLDSMLKTAGNDDAVFSVMIDIDGFKDVNDREGHLAGDKVLREFAEELCRLCGEMSVKTFAARYGGDEFVIAGYGKEDKVMEALSGLEARLGSSASCGIEWGHVSSYASAWEIIDRADRLMYENKRRKARDQDY